MNHQERKSRRSWMPPTIAAIAVTLLIGIVTSAGADNPMPALPPDLFVTTPPPNAVGVGEARRAAREGQPIVVRGRIGGMAKPIANKYAMFLLTDLSLELCKDGCAAPCKVPKEQVLAGTATVQVADSGGRPMKVSVEGRNGLRPLAEVVVKGTVGKLDQNVMIINAQNIFVQDDKK